MTPAFSQIPAEILHEIVDVADIEGLLALCRVGDRRVNTIATIALYKVVEISEESAMMHFCKTVFMRRDLANTVEILKIDCREKEGDPLRSPAHPQDTFERHARCADIIGNLHRLLHLDIIEPTTLIDHLPAGAFPRLIAFTAATYSAALGAFLTNHPTLRALRITNIDSIADVNAHFAPVHLPSLREFTGPDAVARAVLPGMGVTTATILWVSARLRCAEDKVTPERGAPPILYYYSGHRTLSRCGALTELHNWMADWGALDPRAVAMSQPRLTMLQFRVIGTRVYEGRVSDEFHAFRRKLLEALPELHELTHLDLKDNSLTRADITEEIYEVDFRLLNVAHAACPSLEVCMFLARIGWGRTSPCREWYPSRRAPQEFKSWALARDIAL